ncbi:hypothetical protein TWF481_001900 [Arthrobotrys musiformis]|uniref:Uncharacterized protein n=1 Tax=Arthrobotrys musiformis TaxID=47236 RepID=A0AAV9VVQ3_9PEZI
MAPEESKGAQASILPDSDIDFQFRRGRERPFGLKPQSRYSPRFGGSTSPIRRHKMATRSQSRDSTPITPNGTISSQFDPGNENRNPRQQALEYSNLSQPIPVHTAPRSKSAPTSPFDKLKRSISKLEAAVKAGDQWMTQELGHKVVKRLKEGNLECEHRLEQLQDCHETLDRLTRERQGSSLPQNPEFSAPRPSSPPQHLLFPDGYCADPVNNTEIEHLQRFYDPAGTPMLQSHPQPTLGLPEIRISIGWGADDTSLFNPDQGTSPDCFDNLPDPSEDPVKLHAFAAEAGGISYKKEIATPPARPDYGVTEYELRYGGRSGCTNLDEFRSGSRRSELYRNDGDAEWASQGARMS